MVIRKGLCNAFGDFLCIKELHMHRVAEKIRTKTNTNNSCVEYEYSSNKPTHCRLSGGLEETLK